MTDLLTLRADEVPSQPQPGTVLVELYNCSDEPTVQRPNYVCAACHAEIGPVRSMITSRLNLSPLISGTNLLLGLLASSFLKCI